MTHTKLSLMFLTGIQCQDLQTETNTKIHVVKGSVSSEVGAVEEASVGLASTSKSQSHVKRKILEELASCNRALREYERLNLALIENESDNEEKKRWKAAVEIVKLHVSEFIRDILRESENESHIDAVKDLKKMIEEHVFNTNKDIKKFEKKMKKNQPISKKNKK